MLNLALLCIGAAVLLWLSDKVYPRENALSRGNLRHFMRRRSDGFMLAAIIWMTCFAFLRTHYNDTDAYINGFTDARSVAEEFASGTYTDWVENPLSSLYRDIMRGLTDNYHIYFLFPALLHSIAVVKLCKFYSDSPGMSILLYFALGTFTLYLAAFKQNMAMTILLLALPYAQQKKNVHYVLLVLLATLFHFYAIAFLIVPFLFGKPWGKTSWIILGATLFALATYDATLGALMENVEEMGGNIAAEELFDGHSVNVLRVVVYWVPGLLALVFRRHLIYDSDRMENLFVNLSILCACVLSIGLAEGANLYGRMAGYFEIAMAISLPRMLKKIFTRESARLASGIAVGLYLIYFFYEFMIARDFSGDYRAISLWQFVQELTG